MKFKIAKRTFLGTIAGVAVLAAGIPAKVLAEANYILSTATTGGTYYPVGVALATLTKVKLEPKQKISMSAISSAGSRENVKLLRENQAQFAILQGLYGAWAWQGTGGVANDGPQKYLRSVSMLWQNVEHFVVARDFVKTGTVDDLAAMNGAKFSIGRRNSGTEGSGRYILGGLGIDPDATFDLAYLGYGGSAQALQNGNISGMNIPAGAPVSAITSAAAAIGDGMRILNFTDEQLLQANGGLDLWTRYVIAPNSYPGQTEAVQTIAQPNILAVREDVDAEHVYQITKTIYENLPFLNAIHKATRVMALEKAITGLPMPLHPGALRYYKEQGLEIPERLMAN